MNFLSGYLTDVAPVLSALGTLNKSLSFFAAFSLVGILLAIAFLLIEEEGKLQLSALKLRRAGQFIAGLWLVTSTFQIVLTLANILGTTISVALMQQQFVLLLRKSISVSSCSFKQLQSLLSWFHLHLCGQYYQA
jgi:putative copper resistance protein D